MAWLSHDHQEYCIQSLIFFILTNIDFIKNYRINLAKELLQNTDLSIQQISEKTGYATVYYFSQQFKQVTGESPGSFRKKRQKFDV